MVVFAPHIFQGDIMAEEDDVTISRAMYNYLLDEIKMERMFAEGREQFIEQQALTIKRLQEVVLILQGEFERKNIQPSRASTEFLNTATYTVRFDNTTGKFYFEEVKKDNE